MHSQWIESCQLENVDMNGPHGRLNSFPYRCSKEIQGITMKTNAVLFLQLEEKKAAISQENITVCMPQHIKPDK